MFNFASNIFIFTLLMWILLYFNDRPLYRSWNYKNIENIYIEAKRSLAENREIKETSNEGSKTFLTDPSNSRNMQGVEEESLQSRTKQKGNKDQIEEEIIDLEEKIDMEHANMTQKQDECNAESFYERTLYMLKSNPRLVFLNSTLLLPILSCLFSIILLPYSAIYKDSLFVSVASKLSTIFLFIGALLIVSFLLRDEKSSIDRNKL